MATDATHAATAAGARQLGSPNKGGARHAEYGGGGTASSALPKTGQPGGGSQDPQTQGDSQGWQQSWQPRAGQTTWSAWTYGDGGRYAHPWREDAEARDPGSSRSNQPAVQQGDSSQQEAATLPRPSCEQAGTGADSAQPATASLPQREQTVPDNSPPQEQATVDGDSSAAGPTAETADTHHTPPDATDEQPPQPHEELTDTCAAAACGQREGEEAAKAEATDTRDATASSKHEGQGDQRRGNKWQKAVIKAEFRKRG